MANYVGTSRTNYFRVKDIEAFKEAVEKVAFDDLEVWADDEDPTKIALGGYCDIANGEDEETGNNVSLACIIQDHIAKDDACIITISGHEKLRYVIAYTILVTSTNIDYFAPQLLAVEKAKEYIPGFETRMEY